MLGTTKNNYINLFKVFIPLLYGRSEFMLYDEVTEIHKQVSFVEILFSCLF